jgi:hypothetical protein
LFFDRDDDAAFVAVLASSLPIAPACELAVLEFFRGHGVMETPFVPGEEVNAMTRTSSRLSAALVLIALLGLSLPVSALDQPRRVPGVLSWLQEWMDTVWSIFVPEAQKPPLSPESAIGMDNSPGGGGSDRGILIDPNGGSGR